MKFQHSAFACDHCHLTWTDLFKLAIGKTLQAGAVKIARAGKLKDLDLPANDGPTENQRAWAKLTGHKL